MEIQTVGTLANNLFLYAGIAIGGLILLVFFVVNAGSNKLNGG